MKRAAIVIGVNKPAALDPLSAAHRSARDFAAWLRQEGFDPIHLFLDEEKPEGRTSVTIGSIKAEVRALARASNLDQLVVYFSGHGFFVAGGELWLLSGAPRDTDEAVNLAKSIRLAGRSGFGHVVLVSDACRSVPRALDGELTDGGSLFDNPPTAPARRTVVEIFYASGLGDPALELRAEEVGEAARRYESVFTQELLKVFKEATPGWLVQKVPLDGAMVDVVPNGRLEEHLADVVPMVVERRAPGRTQAPQGDIKFSEPPTWIGKANLSGAGTDMASDPPARRLDVDKLFAAGLAEAIKGLAPGTLVPLKNPALTPGFYTQPTRTFLNTRWLVDSSQGLRIAQFESKTGLDIIGGAVAEVAGLGIDVERLPGQRVQTSDTVRLWPRAGAPGSVLIRLEDGSGCVVAGLPGFIGAITLTGGRVIDVSYLPSRAPAPHQGMGLPADQIEPKELHSLAAAAGLTGMLRKGHREAEELASLVRDGKAVDPTLAIHASYILGDASITEEARDIARIVPEAFGFQIYDVAMLGGVLGNTASAEQVAHRVVPFCPMRQRGWLHLGVLECEIPQAARQAARHLKPALWTMFEREGMDILFEAVRSAQGGTLP